MRKLPLAALLLLAAFQGTQKPEDDLVNLVRTYLGKDLPTDWEVLESLPNTRWAALPPTALKNCAPDGGCFTRQGTVTLGGRTVTIMATGARTMVLNVYIRNTAAPFGEAAVVAALKRADPGTELVRCPVKGGTGTTSWYKVKGAKSPGFLSIQTVRGARPSEGFVLSYGDQLPALQPNQLAMYSLECVPGAEQKPVSSVPPHQRLAEVVTALLVPATSQGHDWASLRALQTGITWDSAAPKKWDLTTLKNDPNPLALSGHAEYAGRKFSMLASGTATQVKNVYIDESGQHPRGEHMLGVVYEKGIAVRLVRCGPAYTESTNNWYSLQSSRTRPAMIRQSIGYDGNQVTDSYALRLDGTLPNRDPRDRDPGVSGCQ
jgi:hypothetical protein